MLLVIILAKWADGGITMKRSSVVILFFILCCCVLTGCADLLKNEDMEQRVVFLIEAFNEDDADRIFLEMYPDVVTREEFDESYEAVRELWETSDEYTIKLKSINTKKNFNPSGDFSICQAQYYVYTQAKDYTITFTYRVDDSGEGLYQFHLNVGTVPVLVSGGITTAGENSALQWALLIFSALSYLLVIVTVADILRKRPRLYGVWLIAALFFAAFRIQAAPANFHLGGNVALLVLSAFKIYTTGSRNFVFALPVGAIVYWCMRKRLMAQNYK